MSSAIRSYRIGLVSFALAMLLAGCGSAPPIAPSPSAPAGASAIYLVRPGDTLHSLAREFAIPLADWQRHNRLREPSRLRVGQRLEVPPRDRAYRWPLTTLDISSGFNDRRNAHRGLDLRAPQHTEIRVAAAGKVAFAGVQRGFGNVIIVQHDPSTQTVYAHNQRNLVEVGERLRRGQVIATVGRTGNATGFHVHFEMRKRGRQVDPRPYVG